MITTGAPSTSTAGGNLGKVFRWHRPLMILAAAMAGLVVVGIVGMFADSRLLTGLPIWDKPTKFGLSILIYSVTWAWLIAQLDRARRVAWWAGTMSAAFLGLEMVILVGDVVRGTTSHFNMSTPLDATLWMVMAGAIAVVWLATLLVSAILFRNPGPDRARNLAIRAGVVIALIGMALGFLMTTPRPGQLSAGGKILGAHTVGLADGGPGLPLLGWSTVGGDLRIPHFVGMHALQLIPLLLIGCELLSHRIRAMRAPTVRFRLVGVATAGYAGLLILLTWQALRGQSIVHPDTLTAAFFVVLVAGVLSSIVIALRGPRTNAAPAGAMPPSPRT